MKRALMMSLAAALLAACGVDGEPQPPVQKKTGVWISGDAYVGVAAKL